MIDRPPDSVHPNPSERFPRRVIRQLDAVVAAHEILDIARGDILEVPDEQQSRLLDGNCRGPDFFKAERRVVELELPKVDEAVSSYTSINVEATFFRDCERNAWAVNAIRGCQSGSFMRLTAYNCRTISMAGRRAYSF